VLGLLAGVGVLLCASVFEGLPRAAMIGASAVLLLLVVYNLATTCDGACQQSRAEAAQQRAAEGQARLVSTSRPINTSEDCPGRISNVETINSVGKIFNPKGCWSYHWGKGTVIFQGMGGVETNPVDLATPSPHIPWAIYSVRAVKGTTATFQYFLCAGPKLDSNPEKLSCN